jgi:hypothetical protein
VPALQQQQAMTAVSIAKGAGREVQGRPGFDTVDHRRKMYGLGELTADGWTNS